MLQCVAEYSSVMQFVAVCCSAATQPTRESENVSEVCCSIVQCMERWGAGVETQKNVRGEIGGWGRVPFNETYAPSLSTIYDGA